MASVNFKGEEGKGKKKTLTTKIHRETTIMCRLLKKRAL